MRQGQAQGGEIKKLVRDGHKAGQHVFKSNLMQRASQQRPDTQTLRVEVDKCLHPLNKMTHYTLWLLSTFKSSQFTQQASHKPLFSYFLGRKQASTAPIYFYKRGLKSY